MQNQKKKIFPLVVAFIVISAVTAVVTLRAQSPKRSVNTERVSSVTTQEPVVEFTAPEPTDAQERAKRQAKGQRYDGQGLADIPSLHNEILYSNTFGKGLGMPALPVALSGVVITGEVTDAHAFLSNDKAGVYTEFTIRVNKVLKNDEQQPLTEGAPIIADREGGGVHYPSGNTLVHRVAVEGRLLTQGRYLLFLKRIDQDYSVLTAYELRAGRVFPVDGRDSKESQFAVYDSMEESAFLSTVQSSITKCSQAPKE